MSQNIIAERAWKFAELQADYGPYQFPELALQRIWRDLHFEAARLITCDGRSVEIIHPGTWNRLGGPDFLGACLRIGGRSVVGDVEVHVRADDWRAHGHDQDPAYADVVLHVVLFPEPAGASTLGYGGTAIPIAVLLDLIPEDLESHAAAFALESIGWRPSTPIPASLEVLDPAGREAQIRTAAARRWDRKVADARIRIARLGWNDACHTAALEVLGFSRNRAAMLRVASEWPLDRWRGEAPRISELVAAQAGRWSRQGCRPANAPAVRLRQYARWIEAGPYWPESLREADLPLPELISGDPWELGPRGQQLRHWFKGQLCAGAVRGRRFDTLVCDAFLPLLAAVDRLHLELAWVAWPAGDIPSRVAVLVQGRVGKPRPLRRVANGWVQGIWECCLEPTRASVGSLSGS